MPDVRWRHGGGGRGGGRGGAPRRSRTPRAGAPAQPVWWGCMHGGRGRVSSCSLGGGACTAAVLVAINVSLSHKHTHTHTDTHTHTHTHTHSLSLSVALSPSLSLSIFLSLALSLLDLSLGPAQTQPGWGCTAVMLVVIQGYFAHKKQPPPRTLLCTVGICLGPMMVLGRGVVSDERGTPVKVSLPLSLARSVDNPSLSPSNSARSLRRA